MSSSQGSCWNTAPQLALHSTKEHGSPGCIMCIKVYYGLPAAMELNFGKQGTTVSGPARCGDRPVWAEGQRDIVLRGVRAGEERCY